MHGHEGRIGLRGCILLSLLLDGTWKEGALPKKIPSTNFCAACDSKYFDIEDNYSIAMSNETTRAACCGDSSDSEDERYCWEQGEESEEAETEGREG